MAEPDPVVAARVRAWLDVGGSWAAIAAAHGTSDVDAFKQRVAAHLTRAEPPRRGRPVQLALFDATAGPVLSG